MVVDYSAITKQCALERTATKWPPSECCLIMLQPWCNLIAMPVSQQLMLNVICAHKKYIQSHTAFKMPRALAILMQHHFVCCPNSLKQIFVNNFTARPGPSGPGWWTSLYAQVGAPTARGRGGLT